MTHPPSLFAQGLLRRGRAPGTMTTWYDLQRDGRWRLASWAEEMPRTESPHLVATLPPAPPSAAPGKPGEAPTSRRRIRAPPRWRAPATARCALGAGTRTRGKGSRISDGLTGRRTQSHACITPTYKRVNGPPASPPPPPCGPAAAWSPVSDGLGAATREFTIAQIASLRSRRASRKSARHPIQRNRPGKNRANQPEPAPLGLMQTERPGPRAGRAEQLQGPAARGGPRGGGAAGPPAPPPAWAGGACAEWGAAAGRHVAACALPLGFALVGCV